MVNGTSSVISRFEYSYASVQLNVSRTASVSVRTPATARDTVSISPEASRAASAPPSASPDSDASAPGAPPPPPAGGKTPAERAEALFTALDVDQNGSISEDEFVSGAKALLRRGRAGHHEGRHDGPHRRERRGDDDVVVRHDDPRPGDDGTQVRRHEHGRGHRLERRLERLFDRVDTNDDGGLTREELTRALEGVRRDAPTPPLAAPATLQTPPVPDAATITASTSVNISISITIAVQRYTSIQTSAPAAPADGATTPAETTGSPAAGAATEPAAAPATETAAEPAAPQSSEAAPATAESASTPASAAPEPSTDTREPAVA